MKTRKRSFPLLQASFFYVGILLLERLISNSPKRPQKLYEVQLKQAPWAPPSWVFGPAWVLINIFLTRALFILLSKKKWSPSDKALLSLQGGIWIVFCSFGYFYFRKKSPAMAALSTLMDTGLATTSILIARKRDPKFAVNYLPLFAWTWFASSLAVYQALENDDPLLGTSAIF